MLRTGFVRSAGTGRGQHGCGVVAHTFAGIGSSVRNCPGGACYTEQRFIGSAVAFVPSTLAGHLHCQRRAYMNGNCAPVQVNVAGVNPVAATKSHTLTVPVDPSTTTPVHLLLATVLDPLRSAFGHGSGSTWSAVTPAGEGLFSSHVASVVAAHTCV